MKKIINGVLFDTEKMELMGTESRFPVTTKLYKGKSHFATVIIEPFKTSIHEISENKFKKLLGELNVEKYIELYGEDLIEA